MHAHTLPKLMNDPAFPVNPCAMFSCQGGSTWKMGAGSTRVEVSLDNRTREAGQEQTVVMMDFPHSRLRKDMTGSTKEMII